jgi:hypothetical protein
MPVRVASSAAENYGASLPARLRQAAQNPRRAHRLGREGHRGADGGGGAADEGEVGSFEARVRAGQSFCPEKTARRPWPVAHQLAVGTSRNPM